MLELHIPIAMVYWEVIAKFMRTRVAPCELNPTPLSANMSDWTKLLAVNLYGPIFCYRYAAIQMVEQKSGGRIIGKSYTTLQVL